MPSDVPYLLAVVVLAGTGAVFGLLLYIGSRVFAVDVDPRIDLIADALPGANCGACGFGGCRAYAEAVVTQGTEANLCAPGGANCAEAVAKIMGVSAGEARPKLAVVMCAGSPDVAASRGDYAGVRDCRAASLPGSGGSSKLCPKGCLGLGTCVRACPFDAIVMGPKDLPVVIEQACTGCGKCTEACPRDIIALRDKGQNVHVLCKSTLKGKAQKEACTVGCIGCKKCEKTCEFDAIKVVDFVAGIDEEKCTQCGKCVEVCPQACIWDFTKAREKYLVSTQTAAD